MDNEKRTTTGYGANHKSGNIFISQKPKVKCSTHILQSKTNQQYNIFLKIMQFPSYLLFIRHIYCFFTRELPHASFLYSKWRRKKDGALTVDPLDDGFGHRFGFNGIESPSMHLGCSGTNFPVHIQKIKISKCLHLLFLIQKSSIFIAFTTFSLFFTFKYTRGIKKVLCLSFYV